MVLQQIILSLNIALMNWHEIIRWTKEMSPKTFKANHKIIPSVPLEKQEVWFSLAEASHQ